MIDIIARLLFILVIPSPEAVADAHTRTGNATMFFVGDEYNNDIFACAGRTEKLPATEAKWTDDTMPVCAHRTAPCGSWLYLENTKNGKTSWCLVMDRGPYGAINAAGKWVLKRHNSKSKAKWRSEIDLSRAVADALGTKGYARVKVHYWPKKLRKNVEQSMNMLDWAWDTAWR